MKKILKSLIAAMLVIGITLGTASIDASAAAATAKIRKDAVPGKSYTIQTTLPGNVKIKQNVTISYGNEIYLEQYGYYARRVDIKKTTPSAQLKKIKKNTDKIVKSSPVIKSVGYYKQVRPFIDSTVLAIYADSGKLVDGQTAGYLTTSDAIDSSTGYHSFRQHNSTLRFYDTYTFSKYIIYTDAVRGNLCVGVAGVKKPTFDNNKPVKNFLNKKVSITKTNFYNAKKKNLSIFAQF